MILGGIPLLALAPYLAARINGIYPSLFPFLTQAGT